MRVLVTGAYGLIGSAVLARLHRDGHELIAAGRSIEDAARRAPFARWIEADFNKLTQASGWTPLLNGVDAVVNCVGVLEQGGRDDIRRTHVEGTVALFDACAKAGVRRVVHISAIGASAEGRTDFARTKAQADAHLATLDLDWIVLRPALVLAPMAYGGTAMLRALAAFPLFVPGIAGADRIQVVDIDDRHRDGCVLPEARCAVENDMGGGASAPSRDSETSLRRSAPGSGSRPGRW